MSLTVQYLIQVCLDVAYLELRVCIPPVMGVVIRWAWSGCGCGYSTGTYLEYVVCDDAQSLGIVRGCL